MWIDYTRDQKLRGDRIEVCKAVNVYKHIDKNMFFKLKERESGHKKAALVKELNHVGYEKVLVLRESDKRMELSNDCVNASSVNMLKTKI